MSPDSFRRAPVFRPKAVDEKTRGLPFRFTTASLSLLGLILLVLGVLNFAQRSQYQLPDDGVTWMDSAQGVIAWIVDPGGPGDRAGVREGDCLIAINDKPTRRLTEALAEIFRSGVWSKAIYDLVRQGQTFQTKVVIRPQPNPGSIRLYLELLGLLYLSMGAYILVRRRTMPRSALLYAFCLVSFVLYTYSYTGKLDLLDWTIYWFNVFALVLQPALFLHFCLVFPEPQLLPRPSCLACALLYLPGGLLTFFHALVAAGILVLPVPLIALRWALDRAGLMYLCVYFLAAALFLKRAYRRALVPPYKQQLIWVARGTLLAILPFATFYAVPYSLGFIPAPWMTFSTLPLISLPLALGYGLLYRDSEKVQLATEAA